MATSYNKPEEKKGLSPAMIAALVIAAVLFVAYMAYANFGPTTRKFAPEKQTADEFVRGLAKKSGGDFNKLTPEEQQKLNGMTMGHGAQSLAHPP